MAIEVECKVPVLWAMDGSGEASEPAPLRVCSRADGMISLRWAGVEIRVDPDDLSTAVNRADVASQGF